MYAKNYARPACLLMGSIFMLSSTAVAGPYPVDQLLKWLDDATAKLAAIDAQINDLEGQMEFAKKKVGDMERKMRENPSAAATMRPEYEKAVKSVKDLEKRLDELHTQRAAVISYIEWIRIQLEAWEHIKPVGGVA